MAAFKNQALIIGLVLLAAAGAALVASILVNSAPAPPPEPSARSVARPAVAEAVGLLADPAREWTLTVLGDSTGDDPDEFVFLLAGQLSGMHQRPVLIHQWTGSSYADDVRVGRGAGAAIHIWNGSVSGTTGSYALDNLASMARQESDLVILNYGHNYPDGESARTVTVQLVNAIDGQVGAAALLFILQNPQSPETDRSAATAGSVRSLVTEGRYEAVDVYQAFKADGDMGKLLLDGLHPGPAGSKLWADTVAAKLAP